MDIRAAEISAILKEQIKNFGQEVEVAEIGQVPVSYTHLTLPTICSV